MRLSRNELIAKLRLGEDNLLGCKEVRFCGASMRGPSPSDLADELAAFANSRTGGTLLLGIDDKTRDVPGIPVDRLDLVEALVRQAVEDSINPPLAPVIERLTLPDSLGVDHATLRVDIASSLFVHQSPSGYLHRVGSSKRPIPPDYLAQLFQQRSQSRLIRFDELPVVSAQCEDLDATLLERFHPQLSPDANWQSKTGLVVEAEDGALHPSVAGVLLTSLNPQQFLKGAYIQAVAYVTLPISQALWINRSQGPAGLWLATAARVLRRRWREVGLTGPSLMLWLCSKPSPTPLPIAVTPSPAAR